MAEEEKTPVEITRPAFFDEEPGLTTKVENRERALKRGTRALMRNIRDAGQLERAFRRTASKRAPLSKQIGAAAKAYSDIENPLVQRQLIRQAEQNIRANRAADLQRAEDALSNRVSAQQTGLQFRQNQLQNLLSERQQARQYTAQQYFDELAAQRQIDSEERQFQRDQELMKLQTQAEIDRMLAIRKAGLEFFGSRGSGGSGGRPKAPESPAATKLLAMATEGQALLQSGVPWGTVWNSVRAELPSEIADEQIDVALGTQWREPGAYESFLSGQQQAELGQLEAELMLEQKYSGEASSHGEVIFEDAATRVYEDGFTEVK